MNVPVRELKAHLSEYLDRVERGEIISVTNRGRAIARIVPAMGPDNVGRGLAEGWITRASDAPPAVVAPQRPREGTLDSTDLIRHDRDA